MFLVRKSYAKRLVSIIVNVFLFLAPITAQHNDSLICTPVEPYPSFSYKGINETDEACRAYFAEHLIIPAEIMDDGIQGKIYIQFAVEKNGRLSKIKLLRGVHPVLDEMAIKVARRMPRWNPAKKNGEAIRALFVIAIQWGYPK